MRPGCIAIILLSGGCANLLGIAPIKQGDDSGDDAAGPVAGTLKVVVGGTSTIAQITSSPPGIDCPGDCEETFPGGTAVTLSTASTVDFTGFRGGGCTGANGCDLVVDGDATVYARFFNRTANILFTTSTTQIPGSFDSVTAADTICANLATAAGLPQNQYIAWLSNSAKSAPMRLQDHGPLPGQASGWVRPDGRPIANDFFDLTGGKIHAPPRLDEWGVDVGDDAVVMTETQADGTTSPGNHCQDFASESASGLLMAGEPAGGTGRWSSRGPEIACNQPARLYCVGGSVIGSITEPANTAILFVSQFTITGNAGGVLAIDNLCHSEAMGAGFPFPTTMAMISPGSGLPVAGRFGASNFMIGTSEIMRPDHALVGTPDGLLAGDPFAVPPNVTANASYVDTDVWLGGGSWSVYASDCTGWTSNTGFGTTRPASTTRGATFFQSTACNTSHHVLCLNFPAIISKRVPAR